MAERPIFELSRGIEAALIIAAQPGEDVSDLACAASVHRLPAGRNSDTADPEPLASYGVEPFAGDGARGPGWRLHLTAAAVDALPDGVHQARVVISRAGAGCASRNWLLSV